MRGLRWLVSPADNCCDIFVKQLHISPLMAQMILNRDIRNIHAAREYLNPQLSDLHNPYLLPNMEQAVGRLAAAVRDKEPIAIFGDYDVDGLTGTSILYHALSHFGTTPQLYTPHRIEEGYGLNDAAVTALCETAKVIVSVDCGITAVEQARIAREHHVDLIVTDHHEWKDKLPACHSIVHPRLPGSKYPNPHLCGSAVAFKVAWALSKAITGEEKATPEYRALLAELLAFASLGTIADVVPLIGENRIIATYGLRKLPTTTFHGLRALIVSAGLDGQNIDGYKVGFCLAPRINAAGRMGHAKTALHMMTAAPWEEALQTAQELERQNRARQDTERAITEAALKEAEQFGSPYALVVVGQDWHSGVVGIVASRLVEEYYCPALVLVQDGETAHGSARSVEGLNLAEALKVNERFLTNWGGHAMAAGLSMPLANVPAFREALNEYVKLHCPVTSLRKTIELEAEVSLSDLTLDLAAQIQTMGPFGSGNRRPLFAVRNVVINEPRAIGRESRHLTFTIRQQGTAHAMKAVAWNLGSTAHQIPTNMSVDLAVEPVINEWQGRQSVELLCEDILPLPT